MVLEKFRRIHKKTTVSDFFFFFFDKLKLFRSAASLKARLKRMFFPVNFAKVIRTPLEHHQTTAKKAPS